MERLVVVGVANTLLLGKNPARRYLLFICTVPNIFIAFARDAVVGDLPFTVAMAAFELPTQTFMILPGSSAFFQEVYAIGSAAGSAVYVVEG